MEYQRSRRAERVQALGDVATTLFLVTVGLGVLPVGEGRREAPARKVETPARNSEAVSPAQRRRLAKLGSVAADAAELGRVQTT